MRDAPPLRAALYIRVSSEEQAMHGYSLAAQRKTLAEYAQSHHYQVAGYYADEGVSARKRYSKRPAFVRMLDDIRAAKIDIILFVKLDRWFRNIADYYEVQRVLDAHKVQWIATEENYDTTTANGRLSLNIRLSVAQDEADRTSERIKFVFQDKVRRGEVVSGKTPLGYRIENKRLVPDDAAVPVVQALFAHYLETRSIRETCRYALARHSLPYTPAGMKLLLQNERYIGRAHGADGFCKAIVDRETFLSVQSYLAQRAARASPQYPERVYLFSGLLCCAECGGKLAAQTVRGKYAYYRCTKYEKPHGCAHKRRTSELRLESWLLDCLSAQFSAYDGNIDLQKAQLPPVDTPRIQAKMSKLKDLYLNDLIGREEYERDYIALREQLRPPVLQASRPDCPPRLQSPADIYRGFSRPQKKAFWSRIAAKIVIDNDENIRVLSAPGSP